MSILYTIPGWFGNHVLARTFLQGSLTAEGTLPKVLVDKYGLAPVTENREINYVNWLPVWPGGYRGAAYQLNKALPAAPKDQQLIVQGHSMGAGAILTLLDMWEAQTSWPVDPQRILFITMGASWQTKLSWNVRQKWPGQILDVTVQWEKYADYPDMSSAPTYQEAVANCEKGDEGTLLHTYGYQGIDLDAPDRENTVGGTCFKFFDTHPQPLIPDVGYDAIEAAYDRPWLKQGQPQPLSGKRRWHLPPRVKRV